MGGTFRIPFFLIGRPRPFFILERMKYVVSDNQQLPSFFLFGRLGGGLMRWGGSRRSVWRGVRVLESPRDEGALVAWE